MSNIIDGIPYGEGYEPTTVWEPGLQIHERGNDGWSKAYAANQREMDAAIRDGFVYRRRIKPKEEKKKEKTMEKANLIDIGAVHYADFHGTPSNFRIPLIEAARIAQLPEVRAEVERLEKAKRIGPGDWFVSEKGPFDRCVTKREDGVIVGLSGGIYLYPNDLCRKIQSPELIAMLNQEIERAAK